MPNRLLFFVMIAAIVLASVPAALMFASLSASAAEPRILAIDGHADLVIEAPLR